MKLRSFLFLLLTLFACNWVQAQDDDDSGDSEEEQPCVWSCPEGEDNGWCWGKTPDAAKEKNVLYNDYLMNKNYAAALEPLEWLLANTPNLNKSIYQQGEKIYRELEKTAEGEAKIAYQDKLLALLDARTKIFCEEKKNLQSKGGYAYAFLAPRGKDFYEPLYAQYKEIFEKVGKNTNRSNLTYYMKTATVMHKLKKMNDEQILELYDQIKSVTDLQTEKSKDADKPKWVKTSEAIDALLESTVTINCDFVRTQWGEKLKSVPADLQLAKKALRFMLKDKCTDDPLFLTAAEIVFKGEPSVGTGSVIYKKYLAADNIEKAEEYLKKVIELASADPAKQSELYEDLGDIRRKQDQWTEARTHYLKAAELDPSRGSESYTKIGNMYMESFRACLRDGSDPVKDRAVYLIAYDMFAKAGDSSGMSRAQQQFPAMGDIFTHKYEVGQSLAVGCWIGGSTTVRKRP